MTSAQVGSDAWLKEVVRAQAFQAMSRVTRNASGALVSALVTWPDGTAGRFTATQTSTSAPGRVDAYTVTYNSRVVKTVTQPAITRNPSTGEVTDIPALTVS